MKETKKILIVDDDIDVLTVVKTILENEGHEIIMAKGKEEAYDMAIQEKPNLAICDVMMNTHYEGFELAEALKKEEKLDNMPVLMQTSIEVFSSPKPDTLAFARRFREQTDSRELDVLLVENNATRKAGIDYINEDGKTKWLDVDGFISKPVRAKTLIETVDRVLYN